MRALINRVLSGDRQAIARMISSVENGDHEVQDAMAELYTHTGKANIIGVTGPAGVGKSQLISSITRELRRRGRTVGVIAVDPNSPFTGGAILGDRVRMREHFGDKDVFIRSLGTRGSLGGLSAATRETIRILDASGKSTILVETAGAGQSDVNVMNHVNTVLVVVMPGLGDEIQALKAGILEIGNIFVVNKADVGDSDTTVKILEDMLEPQTKTDWNPPIIKTKATTGEGIPNLLDQMDKHSVHFRAAYKIIEKERERCREEVLSIVSSKVAEKAAEALLDSRYSKLIDKAAVRDTSPVIIAEKLLRSILQKDRK
ncbi:MAG: methylmalonyl Co-A mutase-associated GTPase MeaB [Candidatus Bathyarchaeia archaeon]